MNIVQQRQMQKILLVIPDFSMTNANVRKRVVRMTYYRNASLSVVIFRIISALKNAIWLCLLIFNNRLIVSADRLASALKDQYSVICGKISHSLARAKNTKLFLSSLTESRTDCSKHCLAICCLPKGKRILWKNLNRLV